MCKLHQITHKLSKAQRAFSLWVIHQRLHIDKIHTKNSFLKVIIPTLSSKSYFCRQHSCLFWDSSSWNLHILLCKKRFLQPIKLHEISIMMRNWNYLPLNLVIYPLLMRLLTWEYPNISILRFPLSCNILPPPTHSQSRPAASMAGAISSNMSAEKY